MTQYPPVPPVLDIAGAPVHACSFQEVLQRIAGRAVSDAPPVYVVTPNAHHVVMLHDSEPFRRVYRGAWLSLADGMSLVWAARFLGTPVPEKVSGSDLFPALCKAVAGTGTRIFLLGGRPGAAEEASRVLQRRYPGLEIAGTYCPPFGFERDPDEALRIEEAIRTAAPHVLFVGLGAPKQEFWMAENHGRLGVPVSIGVGVSFEFVAGMVQRAPKWARKSGLEWLYRVVKEPRRLWKRYAVTNPRFVWLVLQQRARLLRTVAAAG